MPIRFLADINSVDNQILVVGSTNAGTADYGFVGDENTGMYRPSNHTVGLVANGTRKLLVTQALVTVEETLNLTDVINAGVDTDKFLVLDASGNVDFRTGAQVRSDIGAGTGSGTVTGTGTNDVIPMWNSAGTGIEDSPISIGNVDQYTSNNDLIIKQQIGHDGDLETAFGFINTSTFQVQIANVQKIQATSTQIKLSDSTLIADGTLGLYTGNPADTVTLSESNANLSISSIPNATSDTDKFLVSDGGEVKYRTGAQVRSDIGAGTGSGSVTSVDTDNGVTGGPITGSGTIEVKYAAGTDNIMYSGFDFTGSTVVGTDIIMITDPGTTTATRRIGYVNVSDLPFSNNSGTVTSIATTSPIQGGTITGSGTISLLKPQSGDWWNGGAVVVGTDGVSEMGKYIDFHATDAGTSDYDVRLTAASGNLTVSGDFTINGGDLKLSGSTNVLSNASSASTLNFGDVDESDTVQTLNIKTWGATQMSFADSEITINAGTTSLGNSSDIELGQFSHIELNHTSSSGSGGNGFVIKVGSGTTTAGKVYYMSPFSTWNTVANTSSNSTRFLAVALGTSAGSGMLLQGIFRLASHGFSLGNPLYLSSTSGNFTTTVPSATNSYARVLGYAVDTDHIYFCPDNTWVQRN